MRNVLRKWFSPAGDNLSIKLFGLHFRNSVGLGAGFDKNAAYLNELEALGFGFVEIGTVTPKSQAGNEKPRLFRLPHDKALINRMGFNNDGVEIIKERLRQYIERRGTREKEQGYMVIGGNIGKNKTTPNEEAWKDYLICFDELFDVVDYFVVNVSSPNTPGLRALQEKDALLEILQKLQDNNQSRKNPKPLLLKIAPDLTKEQLKDIADICREVKLDGLVSSNTTIDRSALSEISKKESNLIGAGGLSGVPLKKRSDEVLIEMIHLTKGEVPIIASGGVFSKKDYQDKMNAGASLVQVWTGFIYEGPGIVKKLLAP
ncbi:dihydroorotate dehydrogenase [Bacteroidota bacterium]|nr:dihydroorotate dehydrogenase [Bacteroidota bacterium]